MMNMKQKLGKIGEEYACSYLLKQGYHVIERNFCAKQGEIDIIAWEEATKELVFIEVKTRISMNFGYPIEAINKPKQKHLYEAAKYYLYINKVKNLYTRFDVIEIYVRNENMSLRHTKQIF